MSDIYTCSSLTIAASDVVDLNGGCFPRALTNLGTHFEANAPHVAQKCKTANAKGMEARVFLIDDDQQLAGLAIVRISKAYSRGRLPTPLLPSAAGSSRNTPSLTG